MFCKPCKQAGDLMTAPKPGGPPDVREQPELRQKARELHEACLGKSHCDCLHRVPLSDLEKLQDRR